VSHTLQRIVVIGVMLTGIARSSGADQTPPVLSTTPELPPGSVPVPAQMSGLPLQVGDLPPGMVAVRVVRRTFSDNVQGQTVTLYDPASGKVLESATDPEGRAQFTGMQVGSTVQARTTVDGESLESQLFQLPAQGGVRLVLVAGVGAATSQTLLPPATASAPSTTAPLSKESPGADSGFGASAIASLVLACATVAMGIGLFRRRRSDQGAVQDDGVARDETGTAPSPDMETRPSTSTSSDRRAAAFEELVRLEKDHRAGRIPASDYAGRREALMTELMQVA